MSTLKQKVIHGVFWRMLEQFGMQAITFAVSIVLARVLGPEEFGTVALLTIFLSLSQCLVNSGFGSALIQKKNSDDLDYNSVFYLSIGISLALYLILWFCAPMISSFYGRPVLVAVLRVSALKLLFDAINGVQNSVLSREMLFNLSFRITLSGTVVSGIVGISMAYSGFGIWALVWSTLSGGLVATTVRWFLIGWRPSLRFSWQRLGELFKFGSRIFGSGLLDTFFTQIYGLLIGKWYSTADLAYFNRGERLPQMAMNSIQGSIGSVVFPVLSQMQHDKVKMKSAMRKVMQTSSFIVFPMMFGLAAVAKPVVLLLLTEKWLPAVPFMQLACISYAFWPMHVANLQSIQALGRSDIFLKLEIVKKVALILILLVTFRHGVLAIAIGRVLLAPFSVWINSLPNQRLVDYSQWEQLHDLAPEFLLSVVMAISMLFVTIICTNLLNQLGCGILLGCVVYAGGAILMRIEPAIIAFNKLRRQLK